MSTPTVPHVWPHLSVNLLLQVFDGILTYQVLLLGIPEANPLVSATIASWGEVWGLLLWKTFACVLLLFIFTLRHHRQTLTLHAFKITGGVYGWFGALSLCELFLSLDV
jgi:hypothetical protein